MRSGRINFIAVPPDFEAKASSCTVIHCTDNGCLPSEPTQPKPSVRPRKSIHKTHGHRNPTACGSLVTVTVKLLLFLFGLCDDYTTILFVCQGNFSKFYLFQYFLSSERYIIASAICSGRISSDASRSAMVLATLSTLSCPLAESPRLSNASLISFDASSFGTQYL